MHWLKAKIALIAVGLTWGSLILIMLPLMIASSIVERKTLRPLKEQWLYSILIAQDQLVNCVFGGYFRTTVSSECGQLKLSGSRTGAEIADFIDWMFSFVGQTNHCIKSIEPEDRHHVTPQRAVIGFIVYWSSLVAWTSLVFIY